MRIVLGPLWVPAGRENSRILQERGELYAWHISFGLFTPFYSEDAVPPLQSCKPVCAVQLGFTDFTCDKWPEWFCFARPNDLNLLPERASHCLSKSASLDQSTLGYLTLDLLSHLVAFLSFSSVCPHTCECLCTCVGGHRTFLGVIFSLQPTFKILFIYLRHSSTGLGLAN